jgi:N-glycosylase/DNA lyase
VANRSVKPIAARKQVTSVLASPRSGFGTLTSIPVHGFDLDKTLHSGQVFHWQKIGGGYIGVIDETPVYLEQSGVSLRCAKSQRNRVIRYLGLDHQMDLIEATFPRDSALREATNFSRGLRIVRQPPWECLATFLTSALKQVSQIRAISLAIRQSFGRSLRLGEHVLFSYPRPEILANVRLEDLAACKLGFRTKNVLAAARMIGERQIDLEVIGRSPTAVAREELCRIPGVGPKIANCVLLFAYGRLEVVPVDVWIERALRANYFAGTMEPLTNEIRAFSNEYFGPFGGYAQQYLFHYWRLNGRKPV